MCRKLLAEGADLHATTTDDFPEFAWKAGATPFFMAAIFAKNPAPTLKYLLESKAELDKVDNNNMTPAHACTQTRNTETLRFLLEARADVEKRDNFGLSVLLTAPLCGDNKGVKLLIEAGADVHAQADFKAGMLHQCAVSYTADNTESVELFVNNGVDVNGQFPAKSPEIEGFLSQMREMHLKGDPARKFEFLNFVGRSQTPLNWTAYWNNGPMAKQLLSLRADPRKKDIDGNDCFFWAEKFSDTVLEAIKETEAPPPKLGA
jgi:ankyrin repeat protein